MSSSPSLPPFFHPIWLKLPLILAALGVPIAAITFFSQFIMEHPVLALIIGLLYEMGVFILSFVGQVWQKLQGRWVDRSVEWLDDIIQGNASRYRKEYFEYLYYQHRDFDVKGLTTLSIHALELDQIFVELCINSAPPKQASPDPISQSVTFSEGNHSLWDCLASKFWNNQHLVIIGPPGSGKTTLLKHIALTLVAHKKQDYHREKIPHTFPILLFLRDHVQSIRDQSDFSLVHALGDHLNKWDQPEPPVGWIERQLTKRKCLIMLDGLDEVADPEARLKVVDWVQRQMIAFKKNRFIVTSRPFGYYSNPLKGVAILEVLPFSHEQIELFVYQWYLANEIMSKQKDDPGVRMRARSEAKDLLQRLRNTPALFALTVNPLLLTMIGTVHRYSGQLPGNRMALYAEICEVFLGKRQQARGQVIELTPAQMQLVLEPLAYSLMLKGKRDVTVAEAQDAIEEPLERVKRGMLPETFLQLVENTSGLLLEQKSGVYSFAHLTFQEYLTAAHIREKQLGHDLIAHVEESWWQETIRLYCAMADATPIIAACIRTDPPSVPALALALDYVEEARDVQLGVKTRLEDILSHSVEDADPERRCVVAEALLARRQRQMVTVREGTHRDTSLVTCAEYQLFLNEQRKQGKWYQPDHWNDFSFPAGSGLTPILGVRQSDAVAFCEWLTVHNKEGWYYRLPRAEEWSLEERQKQKELHAETGYWVEDEPCLVWSQGKPSDVLHWQLSDCVTHALELGHILDHALKGNQDLDIDHALYRALDLDRALDSDVDGAHALDRALSRTPSRERVRDLDRARALSRDLGRELNYAHDRTHNRVRAHALSRACNHAHNVALDLYLARDRVLDLDLTHSSRIRTLALDLVFDRDHAFDHALDLYITLFLLQERIAGNLPAYEGILLVKYRRLDT